jgi:translation initiation factor IF-1
MLHPAAHSCKPKPPSLAYDHPLADANNGQQICLKSSHSDHGHCLCWRGKTNHCCDCRQPLAPTVGIRVEATGIPERVQGEVVSVSDGGYFTVKYEDGRKYANYPPGSARLFTFLGVDDLVETPNVETAYSSYPADNHRF